MKNIFLHVKGDIISAEKYSVDPVRVILIRWTGIILQYIFHLCRQILTENSTDLLRNDHADLEIRCVGEKPAGSIGDGISIRDIWFDMAQMKG